MVERLDDEARFWRRASVVLAICLAIALCAICGVVAVFTMKVAVQEVELRASRAQLEKERDMALQMWQLTDAALKKERQRPAPKPIRTRLP